MSYSIQEIAAALGAEAFGATDYLVRAVAEPGDAGPEDLALATNEKYASALSEGKARAAMLWEGADWQSLGLEAAICVPRPRFAMSGLTALMDPGQGFHKGIHPNAFIDPTAQIEPDASIGPFTVIGPGAKIGVGAVIGPQCHVGANAVIGDQVFLREAVSIAARVVIGDRFFAQPGARIGGDGFSFVTPEASGAEKARESLGGAVEANAQSWARIHSLGSVTIGNDVEIGANSAIDRGALDDTIIGNGVKIDNQVMIGHNCQIGDHTVIAGCAGIAGSTKVGRHCMIGASAGINGHIEICDGVMVTGFGMIQKSITKPGIYSSGTGMQTNREWHKSVIRFWQLDEIAKRLKRLERLHDDNNGK